MCPPSDPPQCPRERAGERGDGETRDCAGTRAGARESAVARSGGGAREGRWRAVVSVGVLVGGGCVSSLPTARRERVVN